MRMVQQTKAPGKAMVRVLIGCATYLSRLLEARLGCQVERQTVLGRREHQKRHRNSQPPIKKAHVEADIIGTVRVGVAVYCAAERMGDLVQDDIRGRRA